MAAFFLAMCTGCFHWSNVESLEEVDGAARVRVEPARGVPYVLKAPTRDEVRDAAVEEHARISLWALDGAATAGIVTGVVLGIATPITVAVVVGLLTPRPIPAFERRSP